MKGGGGVRGIKESGWGRQGGGRCAQVGRGGKGREHTLGERGGWEEVTQGWVAGGVGGVERKKMNKE